MRAWSQQVALAVLLIMCCAVSDSVAQDAGMSDAELPVVANSGDNSPVFVPGEEARFIPTASAQKAAKDSLALQIQDFPMQRAAQRPVERSAEKQSAKGKDDSVLTFNFLYYIIQKYKLQDIID